ncbi:nucleotidyltransferase family protein [Nostoc sp. PCC 7107]|uniref:nucleotidyltransferase domain-containing protein n=1 Tax=Nostoc sp. PCC 7107 TaxID=317936 RepID=UPI00029F259C|nr:nucleotidyltransferase family protein [Nostoc sp. PCC 7107]AFY43906.1 hypothetical protein Nos7107_3326 [Nostoc sp. PCC 7107]
MSLTKILDSEYSWSPEIEFLLCCLHNCIDTKVNYPLEKLLDQTFDWDYLFKLAGQHKVFLLLYQNIVHHHFQKIPKNIQPQLQAYSEIKIARNLLLAKKFCEILNNFKLANINIIPFKGSVLAVFAYKNLASREFSDLDFIIDEQDYSQIKQLLTIEDYQPRSELTWWGQDFASKDDKIHLDFHWQLTPACFPYRVDFPNLLQRSQKISLLNQSIIHLSPEDLLLILCVQIVKDAHYRQERLIQICDIAAVIHNSSLDWEYVKQQTEIYNCKKLLFFGLGLTIKLLDITIPLEINQKIADDRVVNSYINHICKNLFTISDEQKRIFGIFDKGLWAGIYGFIIRALILSDSSNLFGKHNRTLVKHLLSYILTPNSRDLEYVSLPQQLYFVYYFVRPMRLALKFWSPAGKL